MKRPDLLRDYRDGRVLEVTIVPKEGMTPEMDMESDHGIVTLTFAGANWDLTIKREAPKKTKLMKLTELLGYNTAVAVLKVIDDHDRDKT